MQKKEIIKGVQDLGINKVGILVGERYTKISKQMVKHLSRESKVTHEDCVVEGKDGG